MLTGKVALVTGASGPIGRAIALQLADAGAQVALQYGTNSPETDHFIVQSDFSKSGFELDLIAKVQAKFGPIDILVNCAADQALQSFEEISSQDINAMINVNVTAIISLTRAFAVQSIKSGGAIVNISSIEAQNPALGHGHYSASKAALDSLTKSFAMEYGPKGIRCNGVAPGLIHRDGIETDWPDGVARWTSAAPLERLGEPDDVAAAVLFLASPAAKWITGATLTVDGGVTAAGGW